MPSKLIALAAASISMAATSPASANHGALDTTFDGDGKVLTGFFGGGYEYADDVAALADGRIVAVGNAEEALALARYNPNGSLDTTFDGDGKVRIPVFADGRRLHAGLVSVAIQPDGKILAAGPATDPDSGGQLTVVVRLHHNGARDSSFSSDGLAAAGRFAARAMALQGDGKILIAGSFGDGAAVVRLLPSGVKDTGFGGGDGIAEVPVPILEDDAFTGVDPLADGRIALVGDGRDPSQSHHVTRVFAARLHSDGRPDTSWASNGIRGLRVPGAESATAADLLEDGSGRWVLTGVIQNVGVNQFSYIARLTASGSPDTSFNTTGFTYANFGSTAMTDIELNPDGKLVVAGSITGAFMVARYTAGGALDGTFDGDGVVRVDFASSSSEQANGLAVAPNGFLVTGGSAQVGPSDLDFALTRHHGFAEKRPPALRVLRRLTLSADEPARVSWRLRDRDGRRIAQGRTRLHAAGRRGIAVPRGVARRAARIEWTATDAIGNTGRGSARVVR